MRCARIPPPCRTMILIMRMLIMMIMMIMMMLKMTTIASGRNYLFLEKKVISPLIFSWFLSILGAWEPVLEAWVTFWAQGSDFSDFWDLTGAKVYLHFGPKMTKNRLKIDPKLNKFFDHFFDRLWSALGTDLVGFWEAKWSQNWSRIGPKSDHEENSKIIKIHWFLYTFEASKAPEINQKSLLRRC